jgi:hypothetical protein
VPIILISLFLTVVPLSVVQADDARGSSSTVAAGQATAVTESSSTFESALSSEPLTGRPIRGVHLTASAAGSKRYRQQRLEKLLTETMVNAVIVDLKEEGGEVYVPGVKAADRAGAYHRAIPDLVPWLAELKRRGIYTACRIVVFKDNIYPRKNSSVAVKNFNGDLWFDRKKMTWLDPYNQEAWKYNILIALEAAKAGFEEVQFDYIRFPTDGNLAQMRFARPYSKEEGSKALVAFLRQAKQVLGPLGVKVSIDVFGLTTTVQTGMGIGQRLSPMAAQVDYVCPMTYPSHYARGEYGIPNPNDEPYRTIHLATRDALKTLGPGGRVKLRPYLQDFSLPGRGIRYGVTEVRAQIQAAADLGVESWTLWNASCRYTLDALKEPVKPGPIPVWVKPSSPKISKTPSPTKNPPK